MFDLIDENESTKSPDCDKKKKKDDEMVTEDQTTNGVKRKLDSKVL